MPGSSTSGVNRLRLGVAVAAVGVVIVLVAPAPAWAATEPVASSVIMSASVDRLASGAGSTPEATGDLEAAGSDVDTAAAAAGPAVTVRSGRSEGAASGAMSGAVSGQAAGAVDVIGVGSAAGGTADLSVESVAAPPAAVPWIVGVLIVLVVAGAARAYQRSPQRAAVRRGRRATHDVAR